MLLKTCFTMKTEAENQKQTEKKPFEINSGLIL